MQKFKCLKSLSEKSLFSLIYMESFNFNNIHKNIDKHFIHTYTKRNNIINYIDIIYKRYLNTMEKNKTNDNYKNYDNCILQTDKKKKNVFYEQSLEHAQKISNDEIKKDKKEEQIKNNPINNISEECGYKYDKHEPTMFGDWSHNCRVTDF
ncbi:hypothetical protein PGSY75_1215600 [Plasmodium gaboni]|uniref:Succinate dehydrogenase assembly factor 4, mitochondrial n=1 Tax=Plasmodium gaboni TaxID=647221 RepID=A0A151LGG4_9APIC|nr:hypothetical protein PGSY75_1215600 [Plasmodium gaboni]KYN97967.1 hypothetical protein PGSY75_1215600 [Plasmodium gaboni]SOV16291.1 conserved Plasmodium protein, unknown function [Plasmodium gaboni]